MKKIILIGLACTLVISGLFTLTNASVTSQNSPFPLAEPTATYTLRKDADRYIINYQRGSDDLDVFVGSAPSDLTQFVDKEIKITGYYVEDEPMCVNTCTDTLGTQTVLKIDTVRLSE